MAKFEEVLPALREGKKIRRKCFAENYFLDKNDCIIDIFETFEELLEHDDWEIVEEPKQKVKYYPALVTHEDCLHYELIYNMTFKDEKDAIKYFTYDSRTSDVYDPYKFIRLITEIPELIKEHEE